MHIRQFIDTPLITHDKTITIDSKESIKISSLKEIDLRCNERIIVGSPCLDVRGTGVKMDVMEDITLRG